MSVLTAIRKQENPDGIDGHNERLKMQYESRAYPIKRVFTKGRDYHNYSPKDVKRNRHDKEAMLNAKWFCSNLCCNKECPLKGI